MHLILYLYRHIRTVKDLSLRNAHDKVSSLRKTHDKVSCLCNAHEQSFMFT